MNKTEIAKFIEDYLSGKYKQNKHIFIDLRKNNRKILSSNTKDTL